MPEFACTVVIPSRNCVTYLPTALATIDLQGLQDLEVIVVDDGSTDGSEEWLAARPRTSFALKVIRSEGVGPSVARNLALDAARTDLIAFLDADDMWWPGKLAPQLAFHRRNPGVGLSFTDYLHVTPDSRSLGTCFEYWRCDWTRAPDGQYRVLPDAEAHILATNVIGTSTVVARKATLARAGNFSAEVRSAEDWALWLRMAATSDVAFSTSITAGYLMRPDSVTSNKAARIAAMRDIVDGYRHRTEPAFRAALALADARLSDAEAEAARAAGNSLKAVARHLRSFAIAPSRRSGREVISSLASLPAAMALRAGLR